jgi:hypothetical protein
VLGNCGQWRKALELTQSDIGTFNLPHGDS